MSTQTTKLSPKYWYIISQYIAPSVSVSLLKTLKVSSVLQGEALEATKFSAALDQLV